MFSMSFMSFWKRPVRVRASPPFLFHVYINKLYQIPSIASATPAAAAAVAAVGKREYYILFF
jgi:hypothetical protein